MRKRRLIGSLIGIAGLLGTSGYLIRQYLWNPSPPRIKDNKKLIACIGDSITYGAAVAMTRFKESYPAYLDSLLDDNWQVLNYGLSGRTLMDEGDNPYRKEKFFEISKQIEADIYLIMLGTNDSKHFNWNERLYYQELKEYVKTYKQYVKEKVILLLPPKAFPQGEGKPIAYEIENEIIYEKIIPIIKKVASDLEVDYIDLYSLTEDHPEYFKDGVHPNALGNKRIAEHIYKYLIDNAYI